MAFTGTPVVKRVSSSLVRITGISLDASAVGTISCFPGTGEIKLDEEFHPTVFGNVTLQDSLEITILPGVNIGVVKTGTTTSDWLATFTNNYVTPSSGVNSSNMFFGLTAGTGNGGSSDYAGTVAVGAAVPFPQTGPGSGGVVAGGTNEFVLPTTGLYKVSWAVDFLEASQLEVALNGTAVANTCTMSGAGTQQNSNTVIISAEAGDLLSIINPAGNAAALTVQTADGSRTHAQAPSLVIESLGSDEGAAGTPTATGDLEIYVRHH